MEEMESLKGPSSCPQRQAVGIGPFSRPGAATCTATLGHMPAEGLRALSTGLKEGEGPTSSPPPKAGGLSRHSTLSQVRWPHLGKEAACGRDLAGPCFILRNWGACFW